MERHGGTDTLKPARAITLVEVLAATVLLAVIVAAMVPLLRDARGINADHEAVQRHFELALAADRLIEDIDGVEAERLRASPRQEAWPDDPNHSRITITAQAREAGPRRWAWVTFECDGDAVVRWVRLPEAVP